MSRRQSVPLNLFLRQADPMPPLFPAPNEGDFYYNTTFHVVRIYRSVDGSDPVRFAWQDLTTGGAEQVNKDTTWSFIGPYDPGDPSNLNNPEGRSSTPIWIDTDSGPDESGGDGGGGSGALDSTWTIVGSTNPGDPSNLPNPNGRKNTPLWIDTSVGGVPGGVGFMGSMGWRQYHWIDDPVDYDLVPPPGYAWYSSKEFKFSRYDLDGNDNCFFFGYLDSGDTLLMEYGNNWDDGDIGRCVVTYARDESEDGYITVEFNDETYFSSATPYPEGIVRFGIYPKQTRATSGQFGSENRLYQSFNDISFITDGNLGAVGPGDSFIRNPATFTGIYASNYDATGQPTEDLFRYVNVGDTAVLYYNADNGPGRAVYRITGKATLPQSASGYGYGINVVNLYSSLPTNDDFPNHLWYRWFPFQVLPPGGTDGQFLKIVGGKPTWTT